MERESRTASVAVGAVGGAPPARPGGPVVARAARGPRDPAVLGAAVSRRTVIGLAIVALALALAPLAAVELPPLTDYPFHIARISILQHWHDWPGLHRFYHLGSFVLPNLAMDLAILGASQLVPIELAGRLFVALTLILMLSGTIALHWSLHRRFSIWPVFAAIFLHNWILIFGFLNYLFGVGLMLWGLALWIGTLDRPPWQRLALGVVVALAVYFAHLASFGLYALALGGFELQRAWPDRRTRPLAALGRLTLAALPFVPPLLLFLLASPTGQSGAGFKYSTEWYWKASVLPRTLLSMNLGLDLLTAAVLLLATIAVFTRGRLVFAREMLLGLALLVATYLVIPWRMFSGQFVDSRIPAALIFLVIASTEIAFARAWVGRAVYLALGALLLVRSIVLTGDWIEFQKPLQGMRQAFAAVPDNSVIVTATAAPYTQEIHEWIDRWRPPVQHGASLALLDRPAFSATLWAEAAQQPIVLNPAWAPLYHYQEQNPIVVENTKQLQTMVDKTLALVERAAGPDLPVYLLLVHPSYVDYPLPRKLVRVADGPRFMLFRIER